MVIDKGGSRAQGNNDKGYYGYSWGHCILIYNGIRVPSGYLENLSSRVCYCNEIPEAGSLFF